MKQIFLVVCSLCALQSGSAQTFSIDWHKIAAGGTGTGGPYQVSGTIGQHDAGGASTGGQYTLKGGFWSLYAVQTPGAPTLLITYTGNQAVVSWPPAVSGWILQTNTDLAAPAWGDYAGPVVNNSITNATPSGNLYFRLRQ